MVSLFDDTEVSRWTLPRGPFDSAAARAHLDQARVRRVGGRGVQLAVTTDERTPLGEILLSRTSSDEPGRYAELAYAIGAAHRRRGLATRAVRLMTDYTCRVLDVHQVLLRINPANTANVAVARACGFELTGIAPIARDGYGPLWTWRRWTRNHARET